MEVKTMNEVKVLPVWEVPLNVDQAKQKLDAFYQALIQLEASEMMGQWEKYHSLDQKEHQKRIKALKIQYQDLLHYLDQIGSQPGVKLNINIEIQ